MLRWLAAAALLAPCIWGSQATKLELAYRGRQRNPIRKVVTMLQAMQKKCEEEAKKEQELYDKFMCYCTKGKADLERGLAAAQDKFATALPEIEAAMSKVTQAKAEVVRAKEDRASAQQAIAEATALRQKGAAAYAMDRAEADANILAVQKAVAALTKGAAGAFLQSGDAETLRRAIIGLDMADEDQQELSAFLSSSQQSSAGYDPQSGEVLGILKQLGDDMTLSRDEAVKGEQEAIRRYEELMVAKKKEVAALTQTVEAKLLQIGELGVTVETQKADLGDTQDVSDQDKHLLAELKEDCSRKTVEWEERSKTRSAEQIALADTIKILNDDDSLDLFKKTLPSDSGAQSFLQLQVTPAMLRQGALEVVRGAQKRARVDERVSLDFLVMALKNKKAKPGFDQVMKMIDMMVAALKKEQQDDERKKDYCGRELDATEKKKKDLEREVSDKDSSIATMKEGVAQLVSEIKALEDGIRALDRSVIAATAQRKAENSEYKELMAANGAAKELLTFAKKRLNTFYNPNLSKMTQGGGGAASFVQVGMRRAKMQRRAAPEPPAETWGAYQTKSEESSGVIQSLDLLLRDLDREMAEADAEEKHAQADYEKMMGDSATKRMADTKALTQKESAKAALRASMEQYGVARKQGKAELDAKIDYMRLIHSECDRLIEKFDLRKEARADETDALNKAKAVLSGADFSFLQVGSERRTAHLRQAGSRYEP